MARSKSAGKRRSSKKRIAPGKAPAKDRRAPRGQVGPQTYAQVRRAVEEEKLPIGEAFAKVAAATGRKPGTIAVTYYRMARRQGGIARRRGPGRPRGSVSRSTTRATGLTAAKVLSRVSAAIREIESVIADQAREIERLTAESRLAARLREALRE